ncbi:hypothetical protein U9M48_033903 [Paspalum notatum var. saurae]|uniref:FRIGIDA-like protein n=1 Tax=Paspalum notatum var. saurae TaxID=547442 RepID=A0AAQ3U9E4_PASNO
MGTAPPPMIPSEDLEAAIADLSSKKESLREAFDCLAACSPYPLSFTWEALDAHEGDIEEEEEEEVEEEEEEVVEEEEEEEEKDEEEEEGEEEEEEEQEVEEEVVEEEEEEEEVEEEEEEEEEEGEGEEADKEMQDDNESIGNQAKNGKEGSKNEEQAVATIVSAGQDNEAEGDAQEIDEGMSEDKEEEQGINCSAMRYAPDPASLILQVVELFLSSKKFKCNATEHAKLVARNWKEMIGPECCGKLDFLSAWGLLHFLISYNIASEFNIHEIIRIFAMTTHKFRSNTIQICKGLGLTDRITDLIDYLIGNGQHLEVFHLAPHFNLEDKYPSVSLLKGYIEKTKQTAVEITCKSLMKKRKRSNKKCKKEEQEPHEGQDSQQQHEQNQNKLIPGSQHQLHQQENKLQATQQQQHIKWSIPATLKLQTHAVPVPLVRNVAQIQKFGHPPYAAIPGVQCYPAFPGWPVAQGMSFVPPLRAPQYMGSLFNPLLPQPPFHPR